MIGKVSKVGVCVSDQQRALDFFTNALGFRVISDDPMGPNLRWIEVAPPGAETSVVPFTPPGLEDRIGTFTNIVFSTPDIQATYDELRARGVTFASEPKDQPGGKMTTFTDPDGNIYVLREGD
jgi:predicted enzyme related to lactoylglutathione lyase